MIGASSSEWTQKVKTPSVTALSTCKPQTEGFIFGVRAKPHLFGTARTALSKADGK